MSFLHHLSLVYYECSPSVFTGVTKHVGWMGLVCGSQLNHNNDIIIMSKGRRSLLHHLEMRGACPRTGFQARTVVQ